MRDFVGRLEGHAPGAGGYPLGSAGEIGSRRDDRERCQPKPEVRSLAHFGSAHHLRHASFTFQCTTHAVGGPSGFIEDGVISRAIACDF